MAKSFVNIEKVILGKFGTDCATNAQPLGLRLPAKLMIEDDVLPLELGQSARNFVKFNLEAETMQCDYDMLKDFVQVFCIDQKVDAHVITAAQQAATDGRGMKGNEVINFGWSPNGNGFAGFGFKLTEDYSSGTKKTSALVKLLLSLEKEEAELLMLTALTNTSPLTDTKSYAKINPGNISSINYGVGTPLFAKGDIHSFKLDIEAKGDGESIYGRPNIDYLEVTAELISKSDASIAKLRAINALAENSPLIITEKLGTNLFSEKRFNGLSRVAVEELSDKRNLKITLKGQVPVLNAVFDTAVVGAVTTKRLTCS